MNCCNHNCAEGRSCPNRKPRDIGAAWRYICGYLPIMLQYRDHAAAKRAGHLSVITKPEPDRIEFVGREPMSGEAKVLIVAVTVTWAIVMALSFPDAINSLWPQLVAALSPIR